MTKKEIVFDYLAIKENTEKSLKEQLADIQAMDISYTLFKKYREEFVNEINKPAQSKRSETDIFVEINNNLKEILKLLKNDNANRHPGWRLWFELIDEIKLNNFSLQVADEKVNNFLNNRFPTLFCSSTAEKRKEAMARMCNTYINELRPTLKPDNIIRTIRNRNIFNGQ